MPRNAINAEMPSSILIVKSYLSTDKYTICTMKNNFFAVEITENLHFTPTASQEKAIQTLSEYLSMHNPYTIMVLSGYAGTGKTQLVAATVTTLIKYNIPFELLAPTGRAAKVLSAYTGQQASTIHRRIYNAGSQLIEEGGSYRLACHKRDGTVFIVDEASMISVQSGDYTGFGSGELLSDLLEYVHGADACRLIIVGDRGQLPPVHAVHSHALDIEFLSSRYGLNVFEASLVDVVRQGAGSAILDLATYLRALISIQPLPELRLAIPKVDDLRSISSDELIDSLDRSYRDVGIDECLVICYSNKRTLAYNRGIRAQVLSYEEELVRGERLMVARNNYSFAKRKDRSDFIANGEIIELMRTSKHYDLYGFRFVDAEVILLEQGEERKLRLIMDVLSSESAALSFDQRQELFDQVSLDYEHISSITDRRKALRKDLFLNALEVKYAYALTCHKAQGGQWQHVYIDLSILSYVPYDEQLCRWLYTAVTRATERLFLINTPSKLLAEE